MGSPLESNVFDTALLFEGGSLRAAYTCAVAVHLLERGVYFDNVYGVSAGSSNTVNYLSRDIERTIRSFTDIVTLPDFGDWRTFVAGKGFFNARYIYEEMGLPGGAMPFDMDTVLANPAKAAVVAFERDTGRDRFFRRSEMATIEELMVRVRASSTLPILMPPPTVDGQVCYDGGFAEGGGLPLRRIQQDGFRKMVVVRTRKRGFRREPSGRWAKSVFWRRPYMRDAVLTRAVRYNAACEMLDRLEREGDAYVFYCDDLTLSGTERDPGELRRNFEAGYAQMKRDWPKLEAFLELAER